MKYRAEIDGLRALAVVPVILFHAGFELFGGGFVGVDVFFVISGYLITLILIEDLENNRFSIVNFYQRRARRILPALFFVMAVCIPFAWMWMLPGQLKDFSQSLMAVSFFVSNMLFWQESGYFDAVADEKPLLHTWSLAVEEQYYILFPIFLFFAWRYGKNRVFWMIAVLAAMSLAMSEWGWRNVATANFYLAPTRAWELFAGSIAAFIVHKRGVQANNALSLLGMAAILFAIFVYDESTPFPSVYALVPVVGVVLLVLFADKKTLVAKLLSTRAFVGIGLISYSAYLWHQPLFAFARIRLLEEPSAPLMGTLSAVSVFLAIFSWRFVEKPFRQHKSLIQSSKVIFLLSLGGIATFTLVGYIGHKGEGFQQRFSINETVYESMARTHREDECFGEDGIHHIDDWFCEIGVKKEQRDFLVFGDSHALSFLPAIQDAAIKESLNGKFIGTSGCTPLLEIHTLRPDQSVRNCHILNERVYDYVLSAKIKTVFLVARWTYYTDGGYSGAPFSYISLEEAGIKTREESRKAFEYGLEATVKAYQDIGVSLVIIPQIPQQKFEPIEIYDQQRVNGQRSLADLSITLSEHRDLQKYVTALFERHSVTLLDFEDVLCAGGNCTVGTEDVSYYFDDDHLSLEGSKLLEEPIREFLIDIYNK